MDFTPTSVDGIDLKQEQQDGIQTQVKEQSKEQEQTQIEGLIKDEESTVLDLETVAKETQTVNPPADETAKDDVVPSAKEPEDLTFETTTIDFDEPKPKQEVVIDTEPSADLLSFLNENNDLIAEFQGLNKNFDESTDAELIEAHLKAQYNNLPQSDINLLLSDFDYDEENGDATEIVKKKIAIQKAVTEAKNYLTTRKATLSQELGQRDLGGPSKADLEAQALGQQAIETFTTSTNDFFNPDKFEGFDFKVGDKKALKVKVNNVEAVRSTQTDINNVIGKFFDPQTGGITDAAGYHKAIFAANNADTLAQHFYQQGRADALTDEAKASKNINMDGRQTHDAPQAKRTWKLVD